MDLINSIFQFFTDNTKKFSHKSILILFTFLIIIFLDNALSFSYYFNNEKKIEQINSISSILKDSTINGNDKKTLITLRQNILNHKTWKDNVWDFFSSIEFKNDNKAKDININIDSKIVKKNIQERNYYIHFITSGWLFILLVLIIPLLMFFNKKSSLTEIIIGIIIIIPVFLFFAWIFAKIFSYIPIIFGNPIYNYILNAVLSLALILIFGFIIEKLKKD